MEYGGLPPRSKPLDIPFKLRFETQENVLQKAKMLPDKELCVVVFMCLKMYRSACGSGFSPKGTINHLFKVVKVHCSLF